MEILPFLKREEVTQSATSLSKLTQCIPVFIMIRPKVVGKKIPLKEDLHWDFYCSSCISLSRQAEVEKNEMIFAIRQPLVFFCITLYFYCISLVFLCISIVFLLYFSCISFVFLSRQAEVGENEMLMQSGQT